MKIEKEAVGFVYQKLVTLKLFQWIGICKSQISEKKNVVHLRSLSAKLTKIGKTVVEINEILSLFS